MSENNIPKIKPVTAVLAIDNLKIPPYQRPYRWKAEKHVKQLLEDIIRESKNKNISEYRIGSLILHDSSNEMNIVDGQQRIVTISLILQALNHTLLKGISSHKFVHKDSKNNIKFNYNYILNFLSVLDKNEKEFIKDFLLNRCTFVVVVLNDLSEAFQMFDSQNARGKILEPADLLKAFHLREMDENSVEEKKQLILRWEQSIEDKLLNNIIGERLFRVRNWKRKNYNYFFTKDDIDEFKGVSIFRNIKEGKIFPYMNLAFQHSLSTNYYIDEPIVNGKRFFNYIHHYIQISKLINKIILEDNKTSLNLNYEGNHRIGDKRLLNLYTNVLITYCDKFGCDINFIPFAKELYRWVFKKRLEKQQIRFETIRNMIRDGTKFRPFDTISSWYYPDINSMRRSIGDYNSIKIEKSNSAIEECIKEIEASWQKN